MGKSRFFFQTFPEADGFEFEQKYTNLKKNNLISLC